MGARTDHFLLEKSRLVKVDAGERSYHIFYQVRGGVWGGVVDLDKANNNILRGDMAWCDPLKKKPSLLKHPPPPPTARVIDTEAIVILYVYRLI